MPNPILMTDTAFERARADIYQAYWHTRIIQQRVAYIVNGVLVVLWALVACAAAYFAYTWDRAWIGLTVAGVVLYLYHWYELNRRIFININANGSPEEEDGDEPESEE